MSVTEILRFELRDKGVEVFGIYAGWIDTEAVRNVIADRSSPDEIARSAMAGIEAGGSDIDADATAMDIRTMLQNDPEGLKSTTWLWAAEFRANNPLT